MSDYPVETCDPEPATSPLEAYTWLLASGVEPDEAQRRLDYHPAMDGYDLAALDFRQMVRQGMTERQAAQVADAEFMTYEQWCAEFGIDPEAERVGAVWMW